MARLSKLEMQELASMLDGVYGIDDKANAFRIDGYLIVQDFLNAADYIRGKHPEL